jgi:hypothetical protein
MIHTQYGAALKRHESACDMAARTVQIARQAPGSVQIRAPTVSEIAVPREPQAVRSD